MYSLSKKWILYIDRTEVWILDCSWQFSFRPPAFRKELHCPRELTFLRVSARTEELKVPAIEPKRESQFWSQLCSQTRTYTGGWEGLCHEQTWTES